MSYLITAAALEQEAANLTAKGNIDLSGTTPYVGVDGTGAYAMFDSSNNAVVLGPGSSTKSILKFASTADSHIADSNGVEIIQISPADTLGSNSNWIKVSGAAATASPTITVSNGGSVGDDSNQELNLTGIGTGTVSFGKGQSAPPGIQIYGGSGGANALKFLLDSAVGTSDAITWPNNFTSSDVGKVLKVASGATTGAITLELAADASGADTYNDITSSAFAALANVVAGNIYGVNDLSSAISQDLPAGSDGDKITVIDSNGGASASNTITLTRAGSDTINGANTVVLDGAYQALVLQFNATTSKWNIV